jgi:gamma-glutamyltranspeptidase/glutathione hydrolase
MERPCFALCALVALLAVAPSHAKKPHPRSAAETPASATGQDAQPRLPPGSVIASAHFLATQAGERVLAEGGNAFDAAVAVASTLAVVEPESSGIGGGDFFLLHEAKSGKDVFIDARETAPAAVKAEEYLDASGKLDHDKALNGALAAGIPGAPAGWVYVAEHYGKLPLKRSLAPSIAIARDGFAVYPRMVSEYEEQREVMRRWPATVAIFEPKGRPLAEGDTMVQRDLGATLQELADNGFRGFYGGPIAQKIVAAIDGAGGHWTAGDLANYRVVVREPLRFHYGHWDIVTAPPPSSGGVALAEMLQVLSAWNLPQLDAATRVHLIVEAMRRAYRDRTFFLGDPDFVKDMPIERLTSEKYAAELRAGIAMDKATPSASLPGAPPPPVGAHTSHFSIIDRDGNYVSATLTVNTAYGSGLIAAGTGVLMNNEMDDFALQAGVPNAYGVTGYDANSVKPGKRPLSSMTPTFMSDPDHVIVLGTPGGSRIITMVLLGILGFDQGLTPQQVVALPRFHHQYLPDEISLEPGDTLPTEVVKSLEAMGHKVTTRGTPWGNMQAVEWDRKANALSGGTDPRNPVGKAAVFSEPASPLSR